jgi:hypothetical protein
VLLAATAAPLPAASALGGRGVALATSLAVTTVEDDLNAFNAGQAAREVLVERHLVPRHDDEQDWASPGVIRSR